MTTAHDIASALAAALAASDAVATAAGLPPRVFLSAIGAQVDIDDGRPIVAVVPQSDADIMRGDQTTTVAVGVFVDSTAGREGNVAASEQRPDGVYVVADGGAALLALSEAVVAVAKTSLPGAFLDNADADWDFSAMPISSAMLTLHFHKIKSF